MYILDASVMIKWFIDEEDSPKAKQLLRSHSRGEYSLVVPDLIIYEVANALKYSKGFTKVELNTCMDKIYDLGLDIIAPMSAQVKAAIDLAVDCDITFYDSFYVALASQTGFNFITADEKLYKKTKKMPFIKLLKDISV